MTREEFLTKVRSNSNPVVVDVWAPWCMPCRMIAPSLERLGVLHAGAVDVWKINADDEPQLARELGVLGIPTLIAFRDGKEVARRVGAAQESQLGELFDRARGVVPKHRPGPTQRDRILRLGGGTVLVVLGIVLVGAWPLALAGALLAFSGVYDRCPIWKAVAPHLIELWGGKKAGSQGVGELKR
jgi:thioredoxin 1